MDSVTIITRSVSSPLVILVTMVIFSFFSFLLPLSETGQKENHCEEEDRVGFRAVVNTPPGR